MISRDRCSSNRLVTLYLVSCTNKKQDTTMAAKDLYAASPRFRYSVCYAESTGTPWYILSAEHGLLNPETVVEPYDRSMKDLSRWQRQQWAERVSAALDQCLDGVDSVCFLTGKDYYEYLLTPLATRGIAYDLPLARLRQGEQVSWLKARCLQFQLEEPLDKSRRRTP